MMIRNLFPLLFMPLLFSNFVDADILRWDNGAVIPGTEDIVLNPRIRLDHKELTFADLRGTDLTEASFFKSNLTSADLTGAIVVGANFRSTTGLTMDQIYSTASYKMKNLQGVRFPEDLTGWNLREQNLMNSDLFHAILIDADLSGANITYASLGRNITKEQLYSTASFQEKNLRGIRITGSDLSGADLTDQDLFRADLQGAKLTDAELTNARINFARLANTKLTQHQLYSTLSYRGAESARSSSFL